MSSLGSSSTVNQSRLYVHPTWRIVVAMVLVQVPGAAIAWRWSPIGDTFLDLWYGAAFALPLGFVFGLLWQKRIAPESLWRHRWIVLGYGLFAVLLPIAGVLTYDIWKRAADAL